MSTALPAVHSVHFYETHEALIDRLCSVVSSGLLIGNSVLIVATKPHREQLVSALARLEVDTRKYARDDRFAMCDAQEVLSAFMVDGFPDPKLFLKSVGKLVAEAKMAAGSKDQGLTVFGEMVSVLWEKGNKQGALALERMWNDLLNEKAFHLHCAYPRDLFGQDGAGILNICESHSHILGILAPTV